MRKVHAAGPAEVVALAEIHHEARILTFDGDFSVYKWARNRKFELL